MKPRRQVPLVRAACSRPKVVSSRLSAAEAERFRSLCAALGMTGAAVLRLAVVSLAGRLLDVVPDGP